VKVRPLDDSRTIGTPGTTETLAVGVIGLGVGEQHARAFAAHPACRVTALCDRDPLKLESMAPIMPDARRYTSAERLIEDPAVSVVAVASQDDDHYRQIMRALEAGKHVFAEKPICLTSGELADIERAWRASGKRLTTNTVLRRSARFRWLYEAVRGGRLGRLFLIEADYIYGRLDKLVDGWRGRIPNYSVTLGGAIHLVDLVLWIAAERPVEVVAVASSRGSRGSGFEGNDLVMALLHFESGLVAKIGANFAAVHPHFHGVLVHGTEATFENTPAGDARLWTSRDPRHSPEPVPAPYPGVEKGDLIPAFVDAVLGRGQPDVTEHEVFAAVAVCLAIDRASAEHRAVQVSYV
jgi:predicted dehydrogenase